MRLIDVVNAPWAITPEMLSEIQGIYSRHLRGEKIDLSALSASTGISFGKEPKAYDVQDGVAIIAIDGVIAKRMNIMTQISGGTSSQNLQRDLSAALADRTVEAIVLAIDSPGGTVDGTPELAQAIFAVRGVKPILSCTDGMMCSAAYWAGSAADACYISSEVSMVGSIGVVAQHVDKSAAQEKAGFKVTDIYAGKYKRIATDSAPLSAEGKAYLQDSVDHTYSVFVNDVAKHLGTTADEVLARMADGRVFNGSQAIEAGLVDGVATLAETVAMARDMARSKKPMMNRPAGAAAANSPQPQKENQMDITQLKAEHPALVEAITAEAQTGMAAAVSAARLEGAAAETARVVAVKAQAIPGHEALVEAMMLDGKSTAADAALAIVGAEKGLRRSAEHALDAEAPDPVPSIVVEEESAKTMKRAAFSALSLTAQREALAAGTKIID